MDPTGPARATKRWPTLVEVLEEAEWSVMWEYGRDVGDLGSGKRKGESLSDVRYVSPLAQEEVH